MTTEPPAMMRPALLVLDVNETLSDLEPMRERFEQGSERHQIHIHSEFPPTGGLGRSLLGTRAGETSTW